MSWHFSSLMQNSMCGNVLKYQLEDFSNLGLLGKGERSAVTAHVNKITLPCILPSCSIHSPASFTLPETTHVTKPVTEGPLADCEGLFREKKEILRKSS